MKISTPVGILIIVVIAVLVGGGILAYQYWWLPKNVTNSCPTAPRTCADGTRINLASPNCNQTCPEDVTAVITVLSPNGGETLEIGKTYEIKWAKGQNSDNTVTIFLNNDKIWSNPLVIKSGAANTGSYSWKIPLSLNDSSGAPVAIDNDNNYKILVQETNSGKSDFSDATFSILAAADTGCSMRWWFDNTTTVCGYKQFCGAYMYYGLQTFDTEADCKTHLPSVRIISPNGGESYNIGDTVTIKWNGENAPANLNNNLRIYWFSKPTDGKPDQSGWIAYNQPLTGSFNWVISNSATDTHYYIGIQGPTIVLDQSNAPFSILCPKKWWFDNTTTVCVYEEFCGAYMYYGLQTFDTQADCQAHLP